MNTASHTSQNSRSNKYRQLSWHSDHLVHVSRVSQKVQEANTCTENCWDRRGSRITEICDIRAVYQHENPDSERETGKAVGSQAAHKMLSPQLSFEDLSNVGFKTYVIKQVYFHTSVIDLKGFMVWSIYFSPDLSRVFLCTCFSSFSFSTHTFEPVGLF